MPEHQHRSAITASLPVRSRDQTNRTVAPKNGKTTSTVSKAATKSSPAPTSTSKPKPPIKKVQRSVTWDVEDSDTDAMPAPTRKKSWKEAIDGSGYVTGSVTPEIQKKIALIKSNRERERNGLIPESSDSSSDSEDAKKHNRGKAPAKSRGGKRVAA